MEENYNNVILYSIFSLIFLIVSLKFLKPNKHNLPPSPPGWLPVIGHLRLLKPPIHRTLRSLSESLADGGGVMSLRLGSRLVYVVSSHKIAAEECFGKNDVVLANRPQVIIGKYVGYNNTNMIAAPYGDHWRNLRRICTIEIFSTHRLNGFLYVRTDEVRRLISRLFRATGSEKMVVEMKPMLMDLTFNNIMRMMTGKRYYGEETTDEEEAKRVRNLVADVGANTSSGNAVDYVPILRLFSSYEKRVKKLGEKTDKFLQGLIDDKRGQQETGTTMIDHLLVLQNSDTEYYTDQIIKGIILIMVIAGTNTSAVTLEWALSNLLNHPDVISKARTEIDNRVGLDRLIEESDLSELPYLKNIVLETLRLHPATPLLVPHMASDDCKVGSYDMPRGATLLVNAWAIHRDPKMWDDPDSFKPERFEKEEEAQKLMAFGLGRRACPGSGLAQRILGLALTHSFPLFFFFFLSPSSSSSIRRFNLFSLKPSRPTASMSFSSHDFTETPLTTAPYGSWKSPITADIISGASKRLGGTAVDSRGRLILLESRPNESGRGVLVLQGDKQIDITPKEFAVRTLTQEYGGGAFRISSEDTLVFSNYKDQRLYKQDITDNDSSPRPITPDYGVPAITYADGVFDSRFNRYVTVREDGREDRSNPITTIVDVNLSGETLEEPKVLVSGNDFYAFPRLDPKCERLAWIEWSHPNMPWDKAELWVGYISEGGNIDKRVCVAGCDPKYVESPTEPKWSSRGELFFVTDRKNGFWNIHKWIESTNEVVSVYSLDGEFAKPLWVFGTNSYEIIESSEEKNIIACSYRQKGKSYLGIVDDLQGSYSLLDIPLTDFDSITLGNQCLYVEGASAVLPPSVAKVTLDQHNMQAISSEIVWSSSPDVLKYTAFFSVPELIEFPTEVPGQNAYAYFYPPTNPLYNASMEEKPPLLVKSHGGPTAESRGSLNLNIQYWTSRGWAFVDVNYGGSTGYGREYRERLLKRWGIVDVDDCCGCAKYLVSSGKADVKRLCISGGSAGGYTTLAALAFRDVFKAGASLYGVADLKMLKEEGHKFESRYIDNLVGDEKDFYERSPINFVDKFSCPIILFQGLEDKVVTPDQSRKIYQALKEKGLPVALIEYEGEQHGFRKAENIKYTLEQQMVFFARVIGGFKVADDISPLKIDNFDT